VVMGAPPNGDDRAVGAKLEGQVVSGGLTGGGIAEPRREQIAGGGAQERRKKKHHGVARSRTTGPI
jgi:hypothetical protein